MTKNHRVKVFVYRWNNKELEFKKTRVRGNKFIPRKNELIENVDVWPAINEVCIWVTKRPTGVGQ